MFDLKDDGSEIAYRRSLINKDALERQKILAKLIAESSRRGWSVFIKDNSDLLPNGAAGHEGDEIEE